MSDDVYSSAAQPMFVSSVFSVLPVPFLLMFDWSMPSQDAAIIAFVAGVILMASNWIYFNIIYSEAGECSEVSVFESSKIFLIVAVIWVMNWLNIPYHDDISVYQGYAVAAGATGLVMYHLVGEKLEFVTWKHRTMLCFITILSAVFSFVIDFSVNVAVVSVKNISEAMAYVSISPFFWLGLSTGAIVVLPSKEWRDLKERLPTIKQSWRLIFFSEILAVVTFATEVLGLSFGNVAVVSLIVGTFPIFVLGGSVLLRPYYGESKFPALQSPYKKSFAVVLVVLSVSVVTVF